jgi:uncharacterized protein (TIGR02145 family)
MKTSKLVLFFVVSCLLFLMTCKKVEKEMMVTTGTASDIMITTAKVTGNILDLGEGATQHGHCYSKTVNPVISGMKTALGVPDKLGEYLSPLENLEPATTYYVKAYISKGSTVVYGAQIDFITKSDAKPILTTAEISALTKNSATSGGNVTDEGGTPVSARGICWSLTTGPTADLPTKTVNGSGTGIFTSNLTGLANGTTYYVRSYATNTAGTAYGNEINFMTYDIVPTLTTAVVSSITSNSAVGGGNIIYNGDASVTSRGVCWGTSHNPSLADSWAANGSGIGVYPCNLDGLNPGTTYYVRAYATNSFGTGYGNEVSFTTLQPPAAITTPASSVITVGATLNGMVNALNYSTVVTFDYGLNTGYGNSKTADQSPVVGNTDTPVSVKITGLTQGATYHYRVKAVSSQGTTYGDDAVFSTVPAKISDIDGNEYNTWLIGSQVWLLENLKVLHYNNGDPVNTTATQVDNINAETEPKYQWSYKEALLQYNTSCGFQSIISAGFGNHTLAECVTAGIYTQIQKDAIINWGTKLGLINLETKWVSQISAECLNTANTLIPDSYGRLYTWYAATDYRKLCPAGWHVPTDAEWTVLTNYLGGESVAGGKLKSTGVSYWTSPNTGATNESGFTAMPVGMHMSDGTFYNRSNAGFWWSITENSPTNVFNREMHYHLASILTGSYFKNSGFSVRCLKD